MLTISIEIVNNCGDKQNNARNKTSLADTAYFQILWTEQIIWVPQLPRV
jgi:hypothetical protein